MKTLKRTLAIVLTFVLIASLAACTINVNLKVEGGTVAANNSNANSGSNQSSATQTTAAPATTEKKVEATEKKADESTTEAKEDAKSEKPADDGESSSELSSSSSKEEILAEYIKVYDTTKADGTLKGNDTITCDYLAVDGKENGTVKKLADSFMKATGVDMPLPPYNDADPGMKCTLTVDDIEEATYTDNGDGTATIMLKPKSVTGSKIHQDAQGKMFNVMEDIAGTLANISAISWSEGDANSNVTLISEGGTGTVTYNKETKLMTKATYVLITKAQITHANVLILKDKNAEATFTYTCNYPAI